MKFEFSAGGIVLKRRTKRKEKTAQNKEEKDLLILVAQHSQHHGWVFPKGLIDSVGQNGKKESKEEAAVREVEEETGAKARIIEALPAVVYWYVFEGQRIKKTVYYFLMEYLTGDITKHDFEMERVEWLPIEEVEKKLTYKSDKKVWEKARKLLDISV